MTRIKSIDGLRGIAALMVVVFHGFASTFADWFLFHPGAVGVRLFFVLSGALISGLLWSMKDDTGATMCTWGRFAYRRALRIFPLAYFVMLLTWLVGMPAMTETPWWYLTFTSNMGWTFRGGEMPSGLGHFWTLAIEEQVYLVWPAFVLFTQEKHWPRIAIGLIVFSIVARLVAWQTPWELGDWTPLRIDAFAAGSLVAWSARRDTAGATTTTLAAIGLSLIGVTYWFEDNLNWSFLQTGLVLTTAAVVGWVWQRPTHPLLAWRPLVWVGTISYGVYVWHLSGLALAYSFGLPILTPGWIMCAAMLGFGIGGAAITWYGFEKPINRLKYRNRASNVAITGSPQPPRGSSIAPARSPG